MSDYDDISDRKPLRKHTDASIELLFTNAEIEIIKAKADAKQMYLAQYVKYVLDNFKEPQS